MFGSFFQTSYGDISNQCFASFFLFPVKDVASSLPWRKLKGSDMIDIHVSLVDAFVAVLHISTGT